MEIFAVDVNQAQIDHADRKLRKTNTQIDETATEYGKYEQTFQLANEYVDNPAILFNRRRLQMIFGDVAVGNCPDDRFISLFGYAISKAKETVNDVSRLLLFGESRLLTAQHEEQRDHIRPAVHSRLGEIKDWISIFADIWEQKGEVEVYADLINTSNITDWTSGSNMEAIMGGNIVLTLEKEWFTNKLIDLHCHLAPNGIMLTRTMHGSIDYLMNWAHNVQLVS